MGEKGSVPCVQVFNFKTLRINILFQMHSIIQDHEIIYVKESHSNTLKYIKMQKNLDSVILF